MLLVSDANIFIDLEKINLLNYVVQINDTIVTTDFVFNELYEEQQNIITRLGIEILSFEGSEISELYLSYTSLGTVGISLPDYSLVIKATKDNGAILSGDKRLRSFSKEQHIEVKGIFYILDKILENELLSKKAWIEKLKSLQEINSRLPQSEFKKRLEQ